MTFEEFWSEKRPWEDVPKGFIYELERIMKRAWSSGYEAGWSDRGVKITGKCSEDRSGELKVGTLYDTAIVDVKGLVLRALREPETIKLIRDEIAKQKANDERDVCIGCQFVSKRWCRKMNISKDGVVTTHCDFKRCDK